MSRKHVFQVRLSDDENRLIFALAAREGLPASEFVRQAIREAAKLRGIPALGVAPVYEIFPDLADKVQNGVHP